MATVLVVDDEQGIRLVLREFLRSDGYDVEMADCPDVALAMLRDRDFDVVVSDIIMPGGTGVDLLGAIRQAAPGVQVIMMTGDPTVETASAAVRAGAADYLAKPISKTAILRSVSNAVKVKTLDDERRRLQDKNREYQQNLERLVEERTQKLHKALEEQESTVQATILAMMSAVESRDPYTAGHQQRVADLAQAIARELALPEDVVQGTYYAAVVHDLGKISVPAEILSNPGRLCKEAMSLIKQHPMTGYKILEKVPFPWPLAQAMVQHHERQDGSGYPYGLHAAEITQEARILGVSDVVEAMASHRPYRPALGIDTALAEIEKNRGKFYDPDIVDVCLKLFRDKHFQLD